MNCSRDTDGDGHCGRRGCPECGGPPGPATVADALAALREGGAIVRPGDLLSSKEAAALLGVDRTTVSRWRSSGYLPAPFDEVGAGPLWLRPVLEVFAAEHAGRADAAGRRPLGTAR